MYGIKIGEIDGEVCLRLDKSNGIVGIVYLSMVDVVIMVSDGDERRRAVCPFCSRRRAIMMTMYFIIITHDIHIDTVMNIVYNEPVAKEALTYANICRATENPARRYEDVTGENR